MVLHWNVIAAAVVLSNALRNPISNALHDVYVLQLKVYIMAQKSR